MPSLEQWHFTWQNSRSFLLMKLFEDQAKSPEQLYFLLEHRQATLREKNYHLLSLVIMFQETDYHLCECQLIHQKKEVIIIVYYVFFQTH